MRPSDLIRSAAISTALGASALAAQTQPAPPPRQVPTFDANALRLVDSIAEAEFRKDSLGSITVGVVSGRDLVWAKSYGYVDRARQRRATPQTVYRIASITKQVTTIMLLQLADKRVVGLSDPVSKYFPEIRHVRGAADVAIDRVPTLLQLATMTSGLSREPNDQRRSQIGTLDRWMQVLTSALPTVEFRGEPGTMYGYSNVGYAMLGAALSRAAGEGYIDYVRRNILVPLGMRSTDFALTPGMRDALAQGVDYDVLYKDTLNYEGAARDHEDRGYGVPAGGLYSTVGDVAKLVSFQLGFGPDTVLRAATIARRNAVPIASPPNLTFGYGLGVQAMRWGDTTAVGHSANTAGYTAQTAYDLVRNYGVIVLRSAGGGNADASRLAIRAFSKLRAGIPAK
jgi:CubicO group peptidase (beta-lactamase class C family)